MYENSTKLSKSNSKVRHAGGAQQIASKCALKLESSYRENGKCRINTTFAGLESKMMG